MEHFKKKTRRMLCSIASFQKDTEKIKTDMKYFWQQLLIALIPRRIQFGTENENAFTVCRIAGNIDEPLFASNWYNYLRLARICGSTSYGYQDRCQRQAINHIIGTY